MSSSSVLTTKLLGRWRRPFSARCFLRNANSKTYHYGSRCRVVLLDPGSRRTPAATRRHACSSSKWSKKITCFSFVITSSTHLETCPVSALLQRVVENLHAVGFLHDRKQLLQSPPKRTIFPPNGSAFESSSVHRRSSTASTTCKNHVEYNHAA